MPTEPPIKAIDFAPTSRNISNSEVGTFLQCKRMYDFTFIDCLAPKEVSDPLQRGIDGHAAFEEYIKARLNGADHERAMRHARDTVFGGALKEGRPVEKVMEIQSIWDRYMNHHQGWPEFDLLGTEERLDFAFTDSLNIAIRYDLFVQEKATGKRLLGDFKFTYDFWTDDDHYLNAQMPKYIGVMRLNNIRVDGGFIEQIRTRKITSPEKLRDPRNLWRRTFYYPSQKKISNVLKQHVQASLEIEAHRALSPEDRSIKSLPVLQKHGACKYCAFTELCNSMNEGVNDLSIMKRINFTVNSYAQGYNPDAPVDLSIDELKDKL